MSLPQSTAAAQGERLAGIASIGGLFLLAGLALIMWSPDPRSAIFITFAFMSTVAPLLAAFLIYVAERLGFPGPKLLGYCLSAFKTVLLIVAISLLGSALFQTGMWIWVPVVPLTIFAIASLALFRGRTLRADGRSQALDVALIIALAAIVFVFSPFNTYQPVRIGLLNYALSAPHFGFWLVLGIAWTGAGIWIRRREGWAFPRHRRLIEAAATSAFVLVILSLYDDSHFVDFTHYIPLVGPAMHALHGGIPMVDVYSQYGFLPWFAYRAAFALFEPTFGTAAVAQRLINVAYFTELFLILYFVCRRHPSALWFMAPAFLLALTTHSAGLGNMWNMNALPMTLGGRYLLPATITLLLVAAPRQYWARLLCLVAIMLASLSSNEILVYTLAPWGYCLLLEAIRRRSVIFLLREAALAVGAIALAQLALIAVVYLSTGAWVDYRPYYDLISRFRPSEESFWSAPFVPNYALWLPINFSYFLILAAASYRAFRGETSDSVVERLTPVACLGLGPLAYFFGRPQEPTLNISLLSFAVVIIGVAHVIFFNPRRFGAIGSTLFGVLALTFAFSIADGFEHFMRPTNPTLGNSTILRHCLSAEGCRLTEVPGKIGMALNSQPLDQRTSVGASVGDDRPRIEEAISMLRRLTAGVSRVGMLVDYMPIRMGDGSPAVAMTAFMATGQWYAWGMSSAPNDGDSSLIIDRILRKVALTPSGMPVIISNERARWAPINNAILERLVARCRLSLVEAGKFQSAFVTEDCKG